MLDEDPSSSTTSADNLSASAGKPPVLSHRSTPPQRVPLDIFAQFLACLCITFLLMGRNSVDNSCTPVDNPVICVENFAQIVENLCVVCG